MHIWLLYHRSRQLMGSHYEIERFEAVAKQREATLTVLQAESIHWLMTHPQQAPFTRQQEALTLPDLVIPRQGHLASAATFGLLRSLEGQGVAVCNRSPAIALARDKMAMQHALAMANLPTPKSALASFPINMEWVHAHIGFPLVIKQLAGAQGHGVMLCRDPQALQDILSWSYAHGGHSHFFLQQYMGFRPGEDVRVIVIRDQVLGAIRRTNAGGFKANVAQGAQVAYHPVTPELEQLALAATRTAGLDIAGVDLLFTPDGYTVCEVNSSPGFRGFESVHGPCVPENLF